MQQGECFDSGAHSCMRMPLSCSTLEDGDSFGTKDDFRTSGWLNFVALQFGMQHLTHKSLITSFDLALNGSDLFRKAVPAKHTQ